MRARAGAVGLATALIVTSCARDDASVVAPTPPPGGVLVHFGGHAVAAEVAATREARTRGLMHRDHLDEHAGMLFVFPDSTGEGFWMKDTLVPLSIAFLERRGPGLYEVVAMLDMAPCRADPCPVYDPGRSYDAALEVVRGWFERAEVGVGSAARVRGRVKRAA